MDDLLDKRLRDFLDELGSEDPMPGSGSAAAVTAALAASIVAMAARATPDWEGSRGAAAQATALRRRVAPLGALDAEAYAESLAAMRLPEELEADVRNMTIRDTLARAAAVPLLIADASTDVALLAVEVADHCEPALRVDAIAAAQLAEGAARAAAELVAVNLGVASDDVRLQLAHELVKTASAAAGRVGVFGAAGS
jgi:methenyltetrahydrofolate cyclohydrolase